MASENSITIEGVDYSIDDFELGDLEWLEDFLLKPLTNLNNLNSVKASVGLIYLIKRRENPAFTIDDARKTKMTAIFGDDDEPEAEARGEAEAPSQEGRSRLARERRAWAPILARVYHVPMFEQFTADVAAVPSATSVTTQSSAGRR
jgi:hypothetical protein